MFSLCKMGQRHQINQMSENKLEKNKHNILSFKKKSCHIAYVYVILMFIFQKCVVFLTFKINNLFLCILGILFWPT
jgi:hypothetical protein